MIEKLANIIFISIPEHLDRQIGTFELDPRRMLPVEMTSGGDRHDVRDLTWEQIVAGMLKILAYAPEHEDADYYRNFILAVTPEIIAELTETAIMKTHNGDLDLAEEIFLALRGLQPGDQRALVNLALLYEQRADGSSRAGNSADADEYEELARETYRELFSADETIPEAHLNAGLFYYKRKEFDEARDHLRAYADGGDSGDGDDTDDERMERVRDVLREIESQDLSGTIFRDAYDSIRNGNEPEGIRRITDYLRSHPDVWNAWFLLGWGQRRIRNFEEAKTAFEHALEVGPRQPDTLNELAICHLELGDHLGARALLKEALKSEPENTKVISNLGILALKESNPEEAAGYFRTVLEIEPDDRIAQAYLNQIADE
jgi:tetratricopeptide (TPR) repeat protein